MMNEGEHYSFVIPAGNGGRLLEALGGALDRCEGLVQHPVCPQIFSHVFLFARYHALVELDLENFSFVKRYIHSYC